MKGLKKLALATAVAAAPFAQAEMTAMDDALLGEMTGQAGVTIELDTAVTIGSLEYTDTDGHTSGTAGTISMSNIAFGGAAVTGLQNSQQDARFDDIKIDIDVDGDDGLVIHLIGTDTKNALLGVNPVDFGLALGDVSVNALGGPLASGINIAGNLGPIDIVIDGDGVDAANDMINVNAYFEVTDGEMTIDVMGLGISNLRVGQDSSPLITNGQGINKNYRSEILLVSEVAGAVDAQAIAAGAAAATAADQSIYDTAYDASIAGAADPLNPTPAEIATADTAGSDAVTADAGATAALASAGADNFVRTDDATLTGIMTAVIENGPGSAAGDQFDAAPAAAQESTARAAHIAGGGTDATFDADVAGNIAAYRAGLVAGTNAATNPNNVTNMAFVDMVIGTANTSYYSLKDNETHLVQNALTVDLVSFNIDVSMDLSLGSISKDGGLTYSAASIGSIAIDDLDLSGTKLKIYGH